MLTRINRKYLKMVIFTLSLIPLITLQKAGLLNEKLEKINPISLYSSKGKCVQIFDNFIKLTDNNFYNLFSKARRYNKLI